MSTDTTRPQQGWLTPSRKGHLTVFGGSFCISFAALFVQGAAMDPSMIAFYRLLFGGTVLAAVALAQRARLVPSLPIVMIMVPAALFFSADLIAWHASIVRIGPGLATILANFQVFFIALYGAFFLREHLSWRHLCAMPLAVAGLWLLLDINIHDMPSHIVTGVALGVLTAIFYTGYILTLRQSQLHAGRLSPVANMAWVSFLAATTIGLFCAAQGTSFVIPSVRDGVILAALGIICQAFGWYLFSLGLPLLPSSRAGLIMLTQPALSFIWDILFCGRITSTTGYLGAVVAIAAIGLGMSSPTKKASTR